MPYLIGLLSRLIFTRAGAWIASALVALGLGLGTQGVVVGPALDYVQSSIGGLPGNIADWLGVLNIDKYFTIIGSAYVAGVTKRVILRKLGA